MTIIVDYGLGNVNSIANMIRHVGATCVITSNPDRILNAKRLILPGVGAFDAGICALKERNLLELLSKIVLKQSIPILGICLGMQLMTKSSEEGNFPGLGWIDAEVRRFTPNDQKLKIPHMGWNTVTIPKNNFLLKEEERQRFYFIHSYYVSCANQSDIIAKCHYGHDFVAAFANKNIFGVQFHPEKSHRFGMAVLRRFLEFQNA